MGSLRDCQASIQWWEPEKGDERRPTIRAAFGRLHAVCVELLVMPRMPRPRRAATRSTSPGVTRNPGSRS
jgi:hypothetical protein